MPVSAAQLEGAVSITGADQAKSLLTEIGSVVDGLISKFTAMPEFNISEAFAGISDAFNGISGMGEEVSTALADAATGAADFTKFIAGIGGVVDEAASGVADFSRYIAGIGGVTEEAVSGLEDAASASTSFSERLASAASSIQDFLSGMGGSLSSVDSFKSALSSIPSGVQGFIGGIGDAVGSVKDFASNLGYNIMNLQIIGQTATQTAEELLGPAASAETMQTAFTTLLGSTKAATDEMKNLDAFASKTPFKTMDIDQAASQLIGFGVNAKNVVPDLTAIGDALSAVGKGSTANLMSVVDIFGKINTEGKLTGGTMMELSRNGINAWAILEQQTGKTQEQLQKMISAGLFPAKDAMDMLTKGIEKNPIYAGGMAKQSQTTAGLISTLKSNWDQMLASFGSPILKGLEPVINNLGNALSSQSFKDFASNVGQKIADAFQNIGNFINNTVVPAFNGLMNYIKSPDFKKFAGDIGYLATQIGSVLAPAFNNAKGPAKDVMDAIGNGIKGASGLVGPFAKSVGDMIGWFKQGSEPAKAVGDALTAIGIAIGLIKLGQFIALLPGLITGIWGWAAAQGAVAIETLLTAAPFLLVGAIVALVVFGIIEAIQHWGAISKWLTGVWGAVASFFEWLWGRIVAIFGGIGQWFHDKWTEAYNKVTGAFGAAVTWFQNLWKGIANDFNSILGGLGQLATNIWNGVTSGFKTGVNWLIDQVNGFIQNIDNINVAGFHVSIPLIPHLASGGLIAGAGLALVGEQGPELVSLPAGARVIPNSQLTASAGSGGSSQPIIINVHVAGHNVAQAILPDITSAVRYSVGGLGF